MFKQSFIEHLIFTTKLRLDFEDCYYNRPSKSLMGFLKKELGIEQGGRYYNELTNISNFYSDQYFKPTKNGDANNSEHQICSFQERFFATIITNHGINPFSKKFKINYENIKGFSDTVCNNFQEDLITSYLIESKYHFQLINHMTDHIYTNDLFSANQVKNAALFSLLPNVFSRHEFISILHKHSYSYNREVNTMAFLNEFLNTKVINTKYNIIVDRHAKNQLDSQVFIDSLLGSDFNRHLDSYIQTKTDQSLEHWILSLAKIIFPLMEMYVYYLVKHIFKIQPIIDQSLKFELKSVPEDKNEDIFNMLVPVIYRLTKVKFEHELPVSKKTIDEEKIIKSFSQSAISQGFISHSALRPVYNSYIATTKIINKSQDQIDEGYQKLVTSGSVLRAFERARTSKKDAPSDKTSTKKLTSKKPS